MPLVSLLLLLKVMLVHVTLLIALLTNVMTVMTPAILARISIMCYALALAATLILSLLSVLFVVSRLKLNLFCSTFGFQLFRLCLPINFIGAQGSGSLRSSWPDPRYPKLHIRAVLSSESFPTSRTQYFRS